MHSTENHSVQFVSYTISRYKYKTLKRHQMDCWRQALSDADDNNSVRRNNVQVSLILLRFLDKILELVNDLRQYL